MEPSEQFKALVNRAKSLDEKLAECTSEMSKIKEGLVALRKGASKPAAAAVAKKKSFWETFWQGEDKEENDESNSGESE